MPAMLTAPGVYLRGAETPPPPLGTAITGFVGIAERGPLNSPQPLMGWSDYVDTFGGFVSFGYLAESVFGFFRNGGEKCWVVRAADTATVTVTPPAGQCAQVIPLAAASAAFLDHNGDTTLRVSALDPGGWGNSLSVRIATSSLRPMRVGVLTQATTNASTQVFIDSVVDLRPGAVIRITEPNGVTGGIDRTIAPGGASLNIATGQVNILGTVGRVFPIGSVVYAQGFRLEAQFRSRRETFDPLSLRRDHARYFASLINAPESMTDYGERRRSGFSSLIRVDQVPPAGVSRFRPADTAAMMLVGGGDGFTQARATFRDALSAPLVTIVATQDRGSAGNGLQLVALPFRSNLALPVPDESGVLDHVVVDDIRGFQVGETVRVGDVAVVTSETATPSQLFPGDMMIEFPADLANDHAVGEPVTVADRFTLEARRATLREPLEVIRNLSGDAAAGTRFIRTALQSESNLLCASTPPAPFATPILAGADSASVTLASGTDPGAIDSRYYTGYQNDGSYFHPAELLPGSLVGLATLEVIEEISLVAIPDVVRVGIANIVTAQTNVLRHCARLGERFALIDAPLVEPPPPGNVEIPPATLTTEDWIASFTDSELRKYGAAYHPWVHSTFDDIELDAPLDRLMPPSGLVAGLFARTDAQLGVNKAPANGQLRGAFALNPPIDRRRHGELNPLGVNCVVKLEDGEVRLMGSRTLSDDLVSRFVSVRRTILSVKKTLAQRMLWAVFEPIDAKLFQRLEGTLITFLQAMLAKGATASQRPSDAFFVRCNADTNPPEQTDLGIVVAEVGIALLAPAEFIVVTARRTPDAVQVIEEET